MQHGFCIRYIATSQCGQALKVVDTGLLRQEGSLFSLFLSYSSVIMNNMAQNNNLEGDCKSAFAFLCFLGIFDDRIGSVIIRGGSRTSHRRGCQSLCNVLVIFSEKPYEIKEILIRKGGARQVRPPKSATDYVHM